MPLNSKILNSFGFRHSFGGLTPLKPKNFDQKLKIFIITQIFAQCSSLDILINTSLHNIVELENLIFFGFRHSFRGLTPLKLKNFDKKLKISIITLKFSRCSSLDVLFLPPIIIPLNSEILNFFGFRHSFRGLTPLKPKNFDQKLKISIITLKFSRCSSLDVLFLPPIIIPLNSEIFNFFRFRHSFRGLTPLKPKNFDQKFKIFIIT